MWRICLAGAPGVENVSNILTLKSKDYITCTDADSNNTAQMDDLAYSLRSLTLGLLPLHRHLQETDEAYEQPNQLPSMLNL